jgi:beta-lactam-binding protein with PASTA domain
VVGLRLGVAKRRIRARIRARKCALGRVRRDHSRRVGRVIGQSPRPGAIRRLGFPVQVTLGRR